MAISIPRGLVEYVLLGPTRDRRQLQDSPILADVWIAFAQDPNGPQEVLITPDWKQTSASVAVDLDDLIHADRERAAAKGAPPGGDRKSTNIAHLQGFVAARLYFDELLRVLVPLTFWWKGERNNREMRVYLDPRKGAKRLDEVMELLAAMARNWSEPGETKPLTARPSSFDRYAALAGLVLWAGNAEPKGPQPSNHELAEAIAGATDEIGALLKKLLRTFQRAVRGDAAGKGDGPQDREALIFQVSLNRQASLAINRSVGSVKGDAATGLFSVNCEAIGWAVVDSGIQGNHPAFRDKAGNPRVKASFDFSKYRKIVSLDNRRIFADGADKKKQNEIVDSIREDLLNPISRDEARQKLKALAEDLARRLPVRWDFVEAFVAIENDAPAKVSDHGTHVAGIIGAKVPAAGTVPKDEADEFANGMCPDIKLYDFRVIADSGDVRDTEFAIIAALQFIRHMNARHDYVTIHGANLSLSIPHDVHNFACGRTPICLECERLVESGVVVVAAAGNLGYQQYQTKDGSYEGYAAFTITDPGNADNVITVGSTHRTAPHTYGVSFFSSRGPTGDGRQKPDLVAPGEKIHGPFREGWGDLDGTSMAAPHVSGAAAMLMARYPEMIGQPRRIKQILCDSATDLGRERSFQGRGMLDVLRALQSI
ncbi:MAG: S8 family peptidase [Bauldia sp.]